MGSDVRRQAVLVRTRVLGVQKALRERHLQSQKFLRGARQRRRATSNAAPAAAVATLRLSTPPARGMAHQRSTPTATPSVSFPTTNATRGGNGTSHRAGPPAASPTTSTPAARSARTAAAAVGV